MLLTSELTCSFRTKMQSRKTYGQIISQIADAHNLLIQFAHCVLTSWVGCGTSSGGTCLALHRMNSIVQFVHYPCFTNSADVFFAHIVAAFSFWFCSNFILKSESDKDQKTAFNSEWMKQMIGEKYFEKLHLWIERPRSRKKKPLRNI